MSETIGDRIGRRIGDAIDATVEGAKTAGSHAKETWDEWYEDQPVTATTIAGIATLTPVVAAIAGKRGLLMLLTGSSVVTAVLLPVMLVELLQAQETLRNRRDAAA